MMNDDAIYCAAVVTTPSLRKYRPSVSDNHNGTVSINYNPTEPGAHTLELNYAGVPVQSSPYKFSVQPVQLGRVSAFGPGLSSGLAGQPASFTVVTKDAGPSHFSLSICLSVCLSLRMSAYMLSSLTLNSHVFSCFAAVLKTCLQPLLPSPPVILSPQSRCPNILGSRDRFVFRARTVQSPALNPACDPDFDVL